MSTPETWVILPAMRTLLLVMLAGGLGSGARYLIAVGFARTSSSPFPWATFTANVIGCFLIGLLGEMAVHGRILSPRTALVLTTGFLGGLTTFSSFSLESVRLIDTHRAPVAGLYLLGSVACGLAFAWLGLVTARGWR